MLAVLLIVQTITIIYLFNKVNKLEDKIKDVRVKILEVVKCLFDTNHFIEKLLKQGEKDEI